MSAGNFAAALIDRAGSSTLTDAASGRVDAALTQQVPALAAIWAATGLKPGDRALLCMDLSPASAIAYLSALWAGLVAVPVDAGTLKRYPDLPAQCQASAAWYAPALKTVPAGLDSLPLVTLDAGLGKGGTLPAVERRRDDLALLAPTSGTTGAARLVAVSHGNLIANTTDIAAVQNLEASDKAMLVLPLHYCFGASVLHSHLWAGGSVVFDRRWMFADKVLHAIAAYGCTTFAGVPTTFLTLLHHSSCEKIAMPTLRRLLQAGGPLDMTAQEELRQRLPQAPLYVMYGQTEATARLTTLPPEQWASHRGSVGAFLPSVEARLVDEQGATVSGDDVGEIWVRGPSITAGYWQDPEATAAKYRGAWLRTGDLGRLDADGCLWLVGRLGTFIKVRGIRVNPEEVESLLRQDPALAHCGVCGVPHPEAGEALAIFVRSDLSAEALQERVRRLLPPRWTCAWVRPCRELPMSSSGKLVRGELARWAQVVHA